jgi:hypothetical protein
MAFPATFNINYYKGDTYEFRIYPKDKSGAAFNMLSYTDVSFTINTSRGTTEDTPIQGYAQISDDGTYVQCAILPGNGALMSAATTYVYDVEISKTASPYNLVFTLITGTVTVKDQVTGA